MNLTGITEFQEVLVKHFLDSLACVKAVDLTKVKKVMDIGTGAGFPGVPLKIAFPHLEECLLDSLKKRVTFLEETFDILGFDKIAFMEEQRNLQKIRRTGNSMIYVFQEQYQIFPHFPSTVFLM